MFHLRGREYGYGLIGKGYAVLTYCRKKSEGYPERFSAATAQCNDDAAFLPDLFRESPGVHPDICRRLSYGICYGMCGTAEGCMEDIH